MTSISSIQQIVAAIRTQMANRVGVADSRQAVSRSGSNISCKPASSDRKPLSALINERIKAIDPDDPRRGRKAFRIFLESVLLADFGEGLINDPAFHRMVDEIQLAMEQDPEIRAAIDQAVASLIDT